MTAYHGIMCSVNVVNFTSGPSQMLTADFVHALYCSYFVLQNLN